MLRAILVFGIGLMIAAGVLLAVNARPRTIDAPTQNAIAAWRAGAVAMVASLPDNKNVSGDQLSATYNGTLVVAGRQANTLMVVKGRAEQASWTALDPTSQALIRNYFGAVAASLR